MDRIQVWGTDKLNEYYNEGMRLHPDVSGYVINIGSSNDDLYPGSYLKSMLDAAIGLAPYGKNIVLLSTITNQALAYKVKWLVANGHGNIITHMFYPNCAVMANLLAQKPEPDDDLALQMKDFVQTSDEFPGIFSGKTFNNRLFVDPAEVFLDSQGNLIQKKYEILQQIAVNKRITFWTDKDFSWVEGAVRRASFLNLLLKRTNFEGATVDTVISSLSQSVFEKLYGIHSNNYIML